MMAWPSWSSEKLSEKYSPPGGHRNPAAPRTGCGPPSPPGSLLPMTSRSPWGYRSLLSLVQMIPHSLSGSHGFRRLPVDVVHHVLHGSLHQDHIRFRRIVPVFHPRRLGLHIALHRPQDRRIHLHLAQGLPEHLQSDGSRPLKEWEPGRTRPQWWIPRRCPPGRRPGSSRSSRPCPRSHAPPGWDSAA